MAKVNEHYHLALQELNAMKWDFEKEYSGLLELLRQGHVETVLQIINHRKAVKLIQS